jgi:A/G-specific adenine glycosylase
MRQNEPALQLLTWYDRHRRDLPWRAKPGETADPYRVWLSEIMLQQTTVQAVKPYYARFLSLFPTVEALAKAPSDAVMQAWAGLGYYSRARNLHACARIIAEAHAGRFPDQEAGLLALPGIGAYTAAAIAAIAFNRPATVVDGNVERVITRLHTIEEPLPAAKPRIRAATAALVPDDRPGDFAQAMMDLGATICTPKRPACALCPWSPLCVARKAGTQDSYPRKIPKAEKPMRFGAAFVLIDLNGAVFVRTRPPRGLLGGMSEVPTTPWSAYFDRSCWQEHAPIQAAWRKVMTPIDHVFTHFPLRLDVYVIRLTQKRPALPGGRWVEPHDIETEAFPTLFRKVVMAGLAQN